MTDQTHAARMDGIYATQRHFYDLTRKYYLLGRDRMIAELAVPPGGSVLEVGCGTGRNLAAIGRRYPDARLYGLDISAAMLATARAKLGDRAVLREGDASAFEAAALFGVNGFDRVVFSYTLSMIPDWQSAIARGLAALVPGGSVHIVDFGQFERLPGWFRRGMLAWLAKFHVEPRGAMEGEVRRQAGGSGLTATVRKPFRGYAVMARIGV